MCSCITSFCPNVLKLTNKLAELKLTKKSAELKMKNKLAIYDRVNNTKQTKSTECKIHYSTDRISRSLKRIDDRGSQSLSTT